MSGFTIENADYEGVLVTNSTAITVFDNEITGNDKNLIPGSNSCPGLPAFETSEGEDCGEGIHLLGVDHSVVARNTVAQNAGGILLSDDTGATHDNLIRGNLVSDNPYDCGITLASHVPDTSITGPGPQGVYHNTIALNESRRNGLGAAGAGAGVGLFASAPGTMTYGNAVVDNQLVGNGLPGVTMHSHTPAQVLNDNVITGNYIAGNGADTDDAATSGPTGINIYGVSAVTGTIVEENIIENESIAIAVKTSGDVRIHLNDLTAGRVGSGNIGVQNLGSGGVHASENWWGCAEGPSSARCVGVSGAVTYTPWLTVPVKLETVPDAPANQAPGVGGCAGYGGTGGNGGVGGNGGNGGTGSVGGNGGAGGNGACGGPGF